MCMIPEGGRLGLLDNLDQINCEPHKTSDSPSIMLLSTLLYSLLNVLRAQCTKGCKIQWHEEIAKGSFTKG